MILIMGQAMPMPVPEETGEKARERIDKVKKIRLTSGAAALRTKRHLKKMGHFFFLSEGIFFDSRGS